MRTTLPLGNSQKKKEISNPAIRKFSTKKKKKFKPCHQKNFFLFWLKGIARWDFRLTQPKTEFIGSPDRDLKITKLYIVLIISFWLKEIIVKIEFQINQALRRSILEVQLCLSLQNLLCKALN